MRKDPLNPKYTRVEVTIGLMVKETIRADWVVEIGDNLWIIGPDRITEVTILEGTLEDIGDKIIEEIMEMKSVITIIKTEIGQEKGHLQEITVVTETEAQLIADRDQGLEQIQIGIG